MKISTLFFQLRTWVLVLAMLPASSMADELLTGLNGDDSPTAEAGDTAEAEAETDTDDQTPQDTAKEMVERAREYGQQLGQYVRSTDSLSKIEARNWINKMSGWMSNLNREGDNLLTSGQISVPEHTQMQHEMFVAVNEGMFAPPAWEYFGDVPDGFYSDDTEAPSSPISAGQAVAEDSGETEEAERPSSEKPEDDDDSVADSHKLAEDILADSPAVVGGLVAFTDGTRALGAFDNAASVETADASTAKSGGLSADDGRTTPQEFSEREDKSLAAQSKAKAKGKTKAKPKIKTKTRTKNPRGASALLDSLKKLEPRGEHVADRVPAGQRDLTFWKSRLTGPYEHGPVTKITSNGLPIRSQAGGHVARGLIEDFLLMWGLILIAVALVLYRALQVRRSAENQHASR